MVKTAFSSAPPRWRPAWLLLSLLGLALLILLVYWPGLHGGFVFDDFGNLVDNASLAPGALRQHFWAGLWSGDAGPLGRELSTLSFAIQIRFQGLDPFALKLVNLLLHLANTALVWLLARRVVSWVLRARAEAGARPGLLGPDALALAVTAAWALAPIQLTAVLYVVQREESLAAGLVLLGLLGYWHGRMQLIAAVQAGRDVPPRAWAWIWGSLIAGTALASLAKETGVMLPAYAAVLEWSVLQGRGARGDQPQARAARCGLLALYAAVLVLPGLAGLAWLLPSVLSGAGYATRDFTLAQRLLSEGRVLVDYLRWIVLPDDNALSLYHDDILVSTGWLAPWTTAACWAALAGLLGLGLALRRRAPLASFGILWFFTGQSLVSTFVPLELVYEHRNYLPALGVFVALFGALGLWAPRRRSDWPKVAGVGLAALAALYAGLTLLRAQVWGNPYRLAYFEATTHQQSPRANYELGRVLYILSSGPDSPTYQFATRQMLAAARLPQGDLQPLQALVFMQAKRGLPVPDVWWQDMRAVVQRRAPGAEDIGALYSLVHCGIIHVCRYDAAGIRSLDSVLDTALRSWPGHAQLHTLRANAAANLDHDPNLAYRHMLRAVALQPGSFAYWNNLVTMQIAAGLLSQAEAGLRRMAELDPVGAHAAQRRALQARLDAARRASAGGGRP